MRSAPSAFYPQPRTSRPFDSPTALAVGYSHLVLFAITSSALPRGFAASHLRVLRCSHPPYPVFCRARQPAFTTHALQLVHNLLSPFHMNRFSHAFELTSMTWVTKVGCQVCIMPWDPVSASVLAASAAHLCSSPGPPSPNPHLRWPVPVWKLQLFLSSSFPTVPPSSR